MSLPACMRTIELPRTKRGISVCNKEILAPSIYSGFETPKLALIVEGKPPLRVVLASTMAGETPSCYNLAYLSLLWLI